MSQQRSFATRQFLSLWNGTTQPYENRKVPPPSPQQAESATLLATTVSSEAEKIQRIHTKFVEDLLHHAAASAQGLDSQPSSLASKSRRQRTRQHSLSEPPLFRTDGPLTPYPIELDSGEKLEPKHATLVRITDTAGEERSIVVAEVDDGSGKQQRVLLALDLKEYEDAGNRGAAVGRKISAEDMYATLGLETQGVKR